MNINVPHKKHAVRLSKNIRALFMYLFALRDLSFIYMHALIEVDDRAKFQEEIAGSRNSYVVSLTFISSTF